jgi:excisionase family DNA binding protein
MSEIYAEPRMPQLLTPEAVATSLAISPRSVRRLIERGELVGIKIGERKLRIAPDDFEAYIERQRGAAA